MEIESLCRDRAGHPNARGVNLLLDIAGQCGIDGGAADHSLRAQAWRAFVTAIQLVQSAHHLIFRRAVSKIQKHVVLIRPRVRPGTRIDTISGFSARLRCRLGHLFLAMYQLHIFLHSPRLVYPWEFWTIIFGWNEFYASVPPILTPS